MELIGFLIVALAASAYACCVWLFLARGRGTPLPFAPPHEFVAEGPYRYTRNPMALSVVAGIAGLSLALGSAAGLGIAALVALALHLYITQREEPELSRRFGESYVSYCERVPRWLPRVPRDVRAGPQA
jgi:protein-S-isoprenylcysteine O-methyltransferase Ste14